MVDGVPEQLLAITELGAQCCQQCLLVGLPSEARGPLPTGATAIAATTCCWLATHHTGSGSWLFIHQRSFCDVTVTHGSLLSSGEQSGNLWGGPVSVVASLVFGRWEVIGG